MRLPLLPIALSGLMGAVLGFFAAALCWRDERAAPAMTPMALRPSSDTDGQRARPPDEVGSKPSARGRRDGAGRETATVGNETRAAELNELRARARRAGEELSAQRKRIAQLESELEGERPARQQRTRHELDLGPEDWRAMAAEGVMKYRLPCDPPSDDVLDGLGLAPGDRNAVRQAFESSVVRLRDSLLPLCAAALGHRMEVARDLSTDSCRQLVMSTASDRSESNLLSAHSVAAFMAGDAPRPGEDSSLTERLFLVLAEESKHFENDLAETFGPEEAHRIAFSEGLCFRTSTHNYVNRPK